MSEHTGTFWLSNPKMTLKVRAHNGIICEAAPIAKVFIGQPLDNLACWMAKMGKTEVVELNDASEHS